MVHDGTRIYPLWVVVDAANDPVLDSVPALSVAIADLATAGGTLGIAIAAVRTGIAGLDAALRAAAAVALATAATLLIRDAAPWALLARGAAGHQRATQPLEAARGIATPVEKNSSAEVKVLSVTVATGLDGCSAKKCVTLWPTN